MVRQVVTIGELAVGIALVLGCFVGVAAFLGAFMNWNYIMAGSASSNGLLGMGAVLLILAWKTAGYYGLDRFILPKLGTTWENETYRRRSISTQTAPRERARRNS